MSDQYQELEVKYFVTDLGKFDNRIKVLGANIIQPRVHEINLCFDTPQKDLAGNTEILRLRKDNAYRLTYKGPGEIVDGLLSRKEIEISISSFDDSKKLLEALGYRVSYTYEKFRTEFELSGVLVSLDEMPFGYFVEVEGPDNESIKMTSQDLNLEWSEKITVSYAVLFKVFCLNSGKDIENLTFSDFENIEVLPGMLGVKPADY